uniref:Uncharacterized protein n=1 Tax=Vespula pensylvanica TaxID=30213 RepID=A0A834U7I4_VESPE|nr:hypothetical protein H0235_010244 [Vespula pensylvanica]
MGSEWKNSNYSSSNVFENEQRKEDLAYFAARVFSEAVLFQKRSVIRTRSYDSPWRDSSRGSSSFSKIQQSLTYIKDKKKS